MSSASDVADYFLSKTDQHFEDSISNLKLQKLLCYAQGLHLARFNRPLFNDKIEAWVHGPVVPELWKRFRVYGDTGIPRPNRIQEFALETQKFLDDVYKVYGRFSAWQLRCMTHREAPWRETPQSRIISHQSLKSHFKTELASLLSSDNA
jgi:uncharacterized phage-associated protein